MMRSMGRDSRRADLPPDEDGDGSCDSDYDPATHPKAKQFLHSVAAELGDRATFQTTAGVMGPEAWVLTPRNPRALTLAVEPDPHVAENLILDYAGEVSTGSLGWLEHLVPAILSGGVQVLEGSGRRRIEVQLAPNDVRQTTRHSGWRGLLPAPGWMRRAKVTQFEPYSA